MVTTPQKSDTIEERILATRKDRQLQGPLNVTTAEQNRLQTVMMRWIQSCSNFPNYTGIVCGIQMRWCKLSGRYVKCIWGQFKADRFLRVLACLCLQARQDPKIFQTITDVQVEWGIGITRKIYCICEITRRTR